MTKYFFTLLFISCFQLMAQESIEPLGTNPVLIKKLKTFSRNIDKNYIYEIDTIHIPFKDDFSSDKFKKFNATPSDSNVKDTVYYKIYNGTVPDPDTARYMFDTTYNYRFTSKIGGGYDIDTFALSPIGTRIICDLDNFPVNCTPVTVWPPYNTVDTVGTIANPDNILYVIPPDVSQDSATVYFVAATDTESLWQDNFAFLNNNYAVDPPTLGVVTFDGLNENGYPYDFSSPFSYGKADYLTSKPIFLNEDAAGNPYSIADSIFFSFYYQAQGLGDKPEVEDSLIVQFWSPNDNQWNSVWSVGGQSQSDFKQIMIPIEDSKYLKPGFKFRFLNYSTLSGSFDLWHIDYVLLSRFRYAADTVRDDVAFRLPTNTLLETYSAMPWRHFKWNPTNFMLSSLNVQQRNNNNTGRLVGNHNLEVFYEGALQQTINNPGTPSINAYTNFVTSYSIPGTYFYDTNVNDTNATFNVQIRHTTTPDFCRTNDTLRFNQEFSDYYAYDDGTAEVAYGVQGVAGIGPKLATEFNLFMGDTIKSVFIHFSPSAYNRSSTNFILTLWNDVGGKPGQVIYENTSIFVPQYNIGVNGFYEYKFDSKQKLNAGKYYVGFRQLSSDRINVGFDMNTDNAIKTFYNSNGTWANTSFMGTLLLRPAFVYQRDYLVGETEIIQDKKISVYPNPTNSILNLKIESNQENYTIQIMDLQGKIIYKGKASKQIDVSSFENGIYLLKLIQKQTGNIKVAKFVKSNN